MGGDSPDSLHKSTSYHFCVDKLTNLNKLSVASSQLTSKAEKIQFGLEKNKKALSHSKQRQQQSSGVFTRLVKLELTDWLCKWAVIFHSGQISGSWPLSVGRLAASAITPITFIATRPSQLPLVSRKKKKKTKRFFSRTWLFKGTHALSDSCKLNNKVVYNLLKLFLGTYTQIASSPVSIGNKLGTKWDIVLDRCAPTHVLCCVCPFLFNWFQQWGGKKKSAMILRQEIAAKTTKLVNCAAVLALIRATTWLWHCI